MLLAFHKSTNVLIATLTDSAGTGITGATVTVTILDKAGAALVTGQTMVDQSDGTYEYIMSNVLLPTEDEIYRAQVTAVKSADTRYAEIPIKNLLDVA